jgi:aminopeptidase YwaD
MFKPILDALAGEYSGERAKRHVEEIARFHRIQSSPGLRAAATYAYDYLRSIGLQGEILRFAGDGVTQYWTALAPQEWECTGAQLRLVQPADKAALLADFAEEKISIIQRSIATPPEGIEAEVVALDGGENEADYAGIDIAGKLVLIKGNLARIQQLAVQRHGALGIIFDGMREQPPVRPALDLAGARQYTSFWWRPEDKRCFGFVLSPRQGEQLRRTLRAAREKGESVRLHAQISARFYNGHMDAATAVIPGELPGELNEEILIVAHICHPQPSANDNASGVGAVLETARALQTLIGAGALPRPRRTIRFLLPPENTGTWAYCAGDDKRRARTVAAINLDMVGENQELCGSSFLVERLPRAMAAPVDTLAVAIQEALAQEVSGLNDLGSYALFRYASTPFNGGSDHYILSDPSVGIPCPMLIEWPDRFYHTSFDTVDKVDPASLRRAGLLAGTYAAFLAGAGPEEAAWLAYEAHTRYKAQLARTGQDAMTDTAGQALTALHLSPALAEKKAGGIALDIARLQKQLLFQAGRHQASLAWLQRLGGDSIASTLRMLQSDAATGAWSEWTAQSEAAQGIAARAGLPTLPAPPEHSLDQWEKAAQAITPRRCLPGPIHLVPYLARLSAQKQDAWYALGRAHRATPDILLDLAMYWADSKRTLLEVADLVELETGKRDVEYLLAYVRLLQELELVTSG